MSISVAGQAPCTVRPARPDDIPVLCLLKWQFALGEGATFVVRASPEDWMRDMFGPDARLSAVVAEAGGTVVGMAIVTQRFCAGWVGPLFAVDDVFVVPDQRGRGIGMALLAAAARHAVERGAPFIELTVREDNEQALRLYRRAGFERVPGVTLVLAGDALNALVEGAPPNETCSAPLPARDAASG
jgi:ribosomal protein S18 acetylase RimI-like enzyme